AGKPRSAGLVAAGSVTRRAGGNPALRGAGMDEPRAGVGLPEAAAALRNALVGACLRSYRPAREVGRHIGAILDAQRLGNGAHDAPQALSGAVVGELLGDRRRLP